MAVDVAGLKAAFAHTNTWPFGQDPNLLGATTAHGARPARVEVRPHQLDLDLPIRCGAIRRGRRSRHLSKEISHWILHFSILHSSCAGSAARGVHASILTLCSGSRSIAAALAFNESRLVLN